MSRHLISEEHPAHACLQAVPACYLLKLGSMLFQLWKQTVSETSWRPVAMPGGLTPRHFGGCYSRKVNDTKQRCVQRSGFVNMSIGRL